MFAYFVTTMKLCGVCAQTDEKKWSIDPKMPDQDNSKTAHVYPSRNASLSKNPQNVKVSQIIQSVITTQ